MTPEEKALGFLGWHERGYLPHCDFANLIQFVTFRLADSLPGSRVAEWRHLLKIEDHREKRARLEAYLDRGHGACHLRKERVARLVEQALLHFHRERYDLRAWCVMPNHVHVLVEVWQIPLSSLVRSWKQFVQTHAASGTDSVNLRWQRDYWDTYMRNEDQEFKAIRYTENNPVKAGMCSESKAWPFSSARFRDEYHRLILPG
ncbi:MAG: transposase [Verrucomicrobia bacterium]|nr:transposase [Verrucomicrobiota bacterium]